MPPPLSVAQMSVNELLLDRLLDSDGGISEFLLPLVINGHVTEGIRWVKPVWSNQIDCGRYLFRVGDVVAQQGHLDLLHEPPVGVDAPLPYYFDDGLAYNCQELCNTVAVRLNVVDLHAPIDADPSSAPYILDICLDYFYTRNPFLPDLLDVFEQCRPGEGPTLLQQYIHVFQSLRHRSGGCKDSKDRRLLRSRFLRFFEDCITVFSAFPITISERPVLDVIGRPHRLVDGRGKQCAYTGHSSLHAVFMSFLRPPEDKESCTGDAVSALIDLFHSMHRGDHIGLQSMQKVLLDVGCLCLLPDTDVHLGYSTTSDVADLVGLEIQRMISYLNSEMRLRERPPAVVCIARSDGDKYTPSGLVESIQNDVCSALNDALGQCRLVTELKIFDIRDNPVLQSRQAFVMHAHLFCNTDHGSESRRSSDGRAVKKQRLLSASGVNFRAGGRSDE